MAARLFGGGRATTALPDSADIFAHLDGRNPQDLMPKKLGTEEQPIPFGRCKINLINYILESTLAGGQIAQGNRVKPEPIIA